MLKNLATRVKTGKVRLSYCKVWQASSSFDGAKPKFSTSIIIPKSDTKTIDAIEKAIQAAYKEGEAKLKGSSKSCPALEALKQPLRDGDLERGEDEAYKDSYFLNANSTSRPGIIDKDFNEITDPEELVSGDYARVTLTFAAYNVGTARGIGCYLGNIMKLEDGEPLGGGHISAADDFADDNDSYLM